MQDEKNTSDPYAPKPLNFAQNAILTVKVLGILGLIGVAVWGASLWTAPK